MKTVRLLEVPHDLPGFLILPITPLLEWPVKGDGPFRAIVNADATVPAFIGMENYRGFTFFRIGDKDIHLAVINTDIAAVALFLIVKDRVAGADRVR